MAEYPWKLISLGMQSPLKTALNQGVASLEKATESHFRPHLCLNGEEGLEIIKKISQTPESANTEFHIRSQPIFDEKNMWLNVLFSVYIDQISWPDNSVILTPRQTSYIIQNLQTELQQDLLLKVKNWYFESFVKNIQKALETISEQWQYGDPLLADVYRNRIFDIHGNGRGHDTVPYTEGGIIGDELFGDVFHGTTFLNSGQDGYAAADAFLAKNDRDRKWSTTH